MQAVDQDWLDQVSPWLTGGQKFAAMTVLPDRITGDKAVFRADTAPLVKLLRAEGADIGFLPTPDQTFQSEYDATAAIFLALLLNVVSNAAWDAFKLLVRTIRGRTLETGEPYREPEITMSVGITKEPDGSSVLWQKVSGPAGQVLDLAESIVQDYLSSGPRVNADEATPEAEPDSLP